jgi:phage/plasmid-like protein (TIGR03299 family)
MSHQFTSGVFLNDTAAWHGLGTVLSGTLPARDAFERAGALFPVETVPLWAGNPSDPGLQDQIAAILASSDPLEAKHAEICWQIRQAFHSLQSTRTGIWRRDEGRILGTAGPDYQVIPNERLLQFAEAIREEVDMDAVVVLRNGAKVAFTAKIRGTDQEVVPGDAVYRNIVGYLGHDGSTAFGGLFSNIRVVCANTLGFALNDANRHGRQFTIRHTENDVAQIDQVLGSIDIARQQFKQVVDDYRSLREVPMDLELYRHWLEQVYQVPAVRNGESERPGRISDMPRKWAQLEQAWNHGLGRAIPGVSGTAYWALNCVTEVESSQRTKGAGQRRLHSTLFGSGAAVIKRANDLALALTHA